MTAMESLVTCPESKASAVQRAGRAGRVGPASVTGCAPRGAANEDSFIGLLPAAATPEMQRSELSRVVLQLKSLGVDNIMSFDWITASRGGHGQALELLRALGALDDQARLTRPVGEHMAEIPLHPTQAKALLRRPSSGAQEEVLTIAAAMSCGASVWQPGSRREGAGKAEAKVRCGRGRPRDLPERLQGLRGVRQGGALVPQALPEPQRTVEIVPAENGARVHIGWTGRPGQHRRQGHDIRQGGPSPTGSSPTRRYCIPSARTTSAGPCTPP